MSPSKPQEPDRRKGGTFIRDTQGKLIEHIPPTRPARSATQADTAKQDASAAAEQSPKTGAGKGK